jgi:hypothetical protein
MSRPTSPHYQRGARRASRSARRRDDEPRRGSCA